MVRSHKTDIEKLLDLQMAEGWLKMLMRKRMKKSYLSKKQNETNLAEGANSGSKKGWF